MGALRLGFQQAVSLWPAAIAAFLCGAAEVLAGLVLMLGLLAWVQGGFSHVGMAALGASGTGWLAARTLRALVEGGAIRQGSQRMRKKGFLSLAVEASRAAPRSLSFLWWSVPLELLHLVGSSVAVAAGLLAYARALGEQQGGVLSSAALALRLSLIVPVSIAWALWGRVALVRAVNRDQGVLISLFEAAGVLARRPWPRVLILLVTGFAALIAQAVLTGMVNAVMPGFGEAQVDWDLSLAGQWVAGVLISFWAALIELTRLQSLLALELEEEPPVAPPPRIIDAEPVAIFPRALGGLPRYLN
jgi:hypothetical protein